MNASAISTWLDPEFDGLAELTLHSLIAGLEAQVTFWREEYARLHAAQQSDTDLYGRIVALEQELDELSAAKAELAARWEQRLSDQHDRHSAELAKLSRQLADARTTAARATHDLQAMRAERDDLRHQLDANNTGNNLTLPGTTQPAAVASYPAQ